MNRGLLLERIVTQLDRHGPTYGPFLQLTTGARTIEFYQAVAELLDSGRIERRPGAVLATVEPTVGP